MKPFHLPEDFLLGSATSAAQIEGGNQNSNWYEWCRAGHIRDGSSILRADDHWARFKEDVALARRLNQQVYRMGIEWGRIEPQEGRFDTAAMARYREEISLLVQSGIRPLVTLHHFTHPLWLCKKGEFEKESVVALFERYVRYVVSHIGDLVSDYITINEPNVYVLSGYFLGTWPPGKKSLRLSKNVFIHMALCHIAAYKAIHEIRKERRFPGKTMVGVANHLRAFRPYSRRNPFDRMLSGLMARFFQDGFIRYMTTGGLPFPASLFTPGKTAGNYCDFIGINYYTCTSARFYGLCDKVRPGAEVNDLGWEIYPQGLSELCEQFYRTYRLPIWITENGICDADDSKRTEYISSHLLEVAKLIERGIPVQRYYHWSLLDNFEWLDGESARFGLVHVDYGTQKRTVTRSGAFYAELCKNGGVTPEMIRRYGAKEEEQAVGT